MSHHSDEHVAATSDSFWEVGNFKRTTKRIEDGNKLCDDLMKLVQERADIEKMYAKQLRDWSKKWNNIIEKGPEYGTTEAAWKGVLMEAEQRCDLHIRVKENLTNEVFCNVKQWQKDNYHKSMMGQLKEKKDCEDMFKKAQKNWAKLYEKTNKAKTDYHNACKAEKSAQNLERNAGGDSSVSQDQLKKIQDRVSKAKEDVSRSREKYESALEEISAQNPKYIEEMTAVFEKSQEAEQKRLEFFKQMLFATHKCLNIYVDPCLPRIYEEFYHTVDNSDYEKDLKWWSNNHGVNMPMNWPSFEDYNTDPARTSKKSAKAPVEATLSSKTQPTNHASPTSSKTSDNNRHSALSNGVSADDDEWDYSDQVVDPNKPGVRVKALYDYEGVEGDELSFSMGDEFEKLEDEDEQGWCTGRKDGRIGLYPANYVEVI